MLTFNAEKTVIFVCIFVALLLYSLSALSIDFVFAESPSFVIQGIKDTENDMILLRDNSSDFEQITTRNGTLLNIPRSNDTSQCGLHDADLHSLLGLGDIKSTNYVSNGDILNGTIWLSEPINPSSLNEVDDILGWIDVLVINLTSNNSLQTFVNRTLSAIEPKFNIIESNRTIIADRYPAQVISYQDPYQEEDVSYIRNNDVSVLAVIDKRGLVFTFHLPDRVSLPYRFSGDHRLEFIRDIVDSFNFSLLNNTSDSLLTISPENSKLSIKYPYDWGKSDGDNSTFLPYLGTTYNSSVHFDSPNSEAFTFQVGNVLSETFSLSEYVKEVIHVSKQRLPGFNLTNTTKLDLAENLSAYKMEYKYKLGGNDYQGLKIISKNDGKIINLTYEDESTNYLYNKPIIDEMIKSIDIETEYKWSYYPNNIQIKYPVGWQEISTLHNPIRSLFSNMSIVESDLSIVAPFTDMYGISWVSRFFSMKQYIDSSYDEPISYSQVFQENYTSMNWDWFLVQHSISSDLQDLETEYNVTGFFEPYENHVNFRSNLASLNYPDKYRIFFSVIYDIVNNGVFCRLSDVSEWGFAPPPKFNMTASPTSLNLKPGDEKDVMLTVQSNTQGNYRIKFIVNESKDIRTEFVADEIEVQGPAKAGTDLKVKALSNASLGTHTLTLDMQMIYTSKFSARGDSNEIINPGGTIIPQNFPLTINIIPPEFNLTASPSSLDVRPGDEKDIQVQITSGTNLNSRVFFTAEATEPIQTEFLPNSTFGTNVAPLGVASSTLRIKIPTYDIQSRPYYFPIVADIFTQNASDIKFADTINQKNQTNHAGSTKQIIFSATILPPLSALEHIENLSDWLSPVNSIWTFITAVGVIVAPFIVRLYSKKRRERETKDDNRIDDYNTPH